MNSAQIKASLVFLSTLCGCALLVLLMIRPEPQRTHDRFGFGIPVVHVQPIKVVAIPPVGQPIASGATPVDNAQPSAPVQKSDPFSQIPLPTTVSSSSRNLTQLDDRNSAARASQSRQTSDVALEPTRQTIEAWQSVESSQRPNDAVSSDAQHLKARRRLHLPESVARKPGQSPILFFDWSVPLLRELVGRNLGCIVVRGSADSEPLGMLVVTGTGWRFAPYSAPTTLAGVKLPLNPEDQPTVRELLGTAHWATGRAGLVLEFFPSAALWSAWSDQQQTAIRDAQLPLSQVAVTAGSVVWETGTPRYTIDEVAFVNGQRQTITLSRRSSNVETTPQN